MEYLTDSIDFAAYLEDTDAQTKVKPAGDFVDEAKERLRQNVSKHRIYLPWEKTKDAFEYRYGEVSLYAGQNGHGYHWGNSSRITIIGLTNRCLTAYRRFVLSRNRRSCRRSHWSYDDASYRRRTERGYDLRRSESARGYR